MGAVFYLGAGWTQPGHSPWILQAPTFHLSEVAVKSNMTDNNCNYCKISTLRSANKNSDLAFDIYLGPCSEQNFGNLNMVVLTGPVKWSHIKL